MDGWLRKVKSLLGFGVAGGTMGAVFGGFWWVGEMILGVPGTFAPTVPLTVGLWAAFGAFASSGAGLLLLALSRGSTVEKLSPARMFAFGALAGVIAPSLLLLILGVAWSPAATFFTGVSGLLGGLTASGLLVAAKKAPDELQEGTDREALGPGS